MLSEVLWGSVLAAVVAGALSIVIQAVRVGITPMPSSRLARRALVELAAEAVSLPRGGQVHELGAGWGGLAFALARKFPQARIVAWESSPVPFVVCAVGRWLRGLPNVELRFADFHGAHLGAADAVVCYLFPGAMRKLAPKLATELRSGAIVVSSAFRLPGYRPDRVMVLNDLFRTDVYLYRSPLVPSESSARPPLVKETA